VSHVPGDSYSVEDKQSLKMAEDSINKVELQFPRKNDMKVPDNRLTVENRSNLKVTVSCFEPHKDK